jgi:F-type H+-transporting ATPase subunit a
MMLLGFLAEIDVGHPTVSLDGLTFNADTIRNTVIICLILIAFGLVIRSQVQAGVPSRLQNATEGLVEYLGGLTEQTLAGRGIALVPLAISLFVFLLIANWIGLVPGLKSPTNDWNTTLGLALMAFFLVQFFAIRKRGLGRYLWHLLIGPPPFPLSVIDELAKPITLSFRLYFNIFVGELLLALILLLPIWLAWVPGVLWLLFSLFIGTVQAFIFTVLTVSYIAVATQVDEGH